MENVGGQAPLLATNRIGTHNSDKQVCLAFCFAAAPWTGRKGHANGRPCHRVHLDCARAHELPASALAPLITWLRSDTVRAHVAPTPALLESPWSLQTHDQSPR
jgi:hypothetical protein